MDNGHKVRVFNFNPLITSLLLAVRGSIRGLLPYPYA
jgi:hypothetical protein